MTVQHELATVADRFLAAFIDLIVIGLFSLLIAYLETLVNSTGAALVIRLVFGVPLVWFYTLSSESFMNGQTLGKKLVRIKVVRLDGRPLTFVDHFTNH